MMFGADKLQAEFFLGLPEGKRALVLPIVYAFQSAQGTGQANSRTEG